MVDSKPKNSKKLTPKEQMQEFRKKVMKHENVSAKQAIKQIATRDKLERDYKEDLLDVEFLSSPETRRLVKARRPTQEEMMIIMRLSAEAAMLEGRMDTKSLQKLVDVYDRLPVLAAQLSIDKDLDEEFWRSKISFPALQSFIMELIKITQQGPMTEGELQSFR